MSKKDKKAKKQEAEKLKKAHGGNSGDTLSNITTTPTHGGSVGVGRNDGFNH